MNKHSLWLILPILSAILLFSACSDDPDPGIAEGPKLNAVLEGDAKFSMMKAAMDRANLGPTLEGRGPYTVLVPTNEAFEDFLSDAGLSSIADIPPSQLSRRLLPHIIQNEVPGSSFGEGYIQTLAIESNSLNSVTLYVNSLTGINGLAGLDEIDIQASNGLIHRIDAVLPIPHLWTHLGANNEFGLFFEALSRLSNTIQDPLENEGPFTVFAPNNAAMLDFLRQSDWDDLNEIPIETLWNILSVHIVPQRNLLASQFTDNMGLNTLSPNEVILTIYANGGAFVISGNMANTVPLEIVNLQASNGIIHMIPEVVIP